MATSVTILPLHLASRHVREERLKKLTETIDQAHQFCPKEAEALQSTQVTAGNASANSGWQQMAEIVSLQLQAAQAASMLENAGESYEQHIRQVEVQRLRKTCPPHRTPDRIATIYLETLSRQRYEISAHLSGSVYYLKVQFYAITGVLPENQGIVFRGRYMDNSEYLEDFGVQEGDTLHLMQLLRGGMYHYSSGRIDAEDVKEPVVHSLRIEVCSLRVTENGLETHDSNSVYLDVQKSLCTADHLIEYAANACVENGLGMSLQPTLVAMSKRSSRRVPLTGMSTEECWSWICRANSSAVRYGDNAETYELHIL
jgi:hypothetical protein